MCGRDGPGIIRPDRLRCCLSRVRPVLGPPTAAGGLQQMRVAFSLATILGVKGGTGAAVAAGEEGERGDAESLTGRSDRERNRTRVRSRRQAVAIRAGINGVGVCASWKWSGNLRSQRYTKEPGTGPTRLVADHERCGRDVCRMLRQAVTTSDTVASVIPGKSSPRGQANELPQGRHFDARGTVRYGDVGARTRGSVRSKIATADVPVAAAM